MTITLHPVGASAAGPAGNGLGRLAAWCYEHRRRVLAGWLLAVVAVIGLAQWAGSRLDNNFALAGGLATTARVITAAAIMVCVFGSFVIGDPVQISPRSASAWRPSSWSTPPWSAWCS